LKLKRIIALTLASLSLTIGLAAAAQATPGRTTNPPPPVPASVRNAESALTSKLAKLHVNRQTRLTARQLKALGLKPDPSWLGARFKKLAHSTRARAAAVGATPWFTYQYSGPFWANVYYSGPNVTTAGDTFYGVYSNWVMCESYAAWWQAAVPNGHTCVDLNVYTVVTNVEIDGSYYYEGADVNGAGLTIPDSDGLPTYGWGPYPG
jgi:hypothetical protein